MNGKIISTTGGIYRIYSDGVVYDVFSKGIFKFRKQHFCVGDNVVFDDQDFVITELKERSNELIRPRCANVDFILVTMSLAEPELSEELIYKFITYLNKNNVPGKVVLTKTDLVNDLSNARRIQNELSKIGIDVFLVSKKDDKSVDELRQAIDGKTVLFMGQTGVGKSSLMNLINPSFDRSVGDYSHTLGRGKHQTKEIILYPYKNGFIGDTPGFSSLDLVLFKEDLAQYFPGYERYYTECYFSNCLHQNEKQCKIKEEIEKGNLSKQGYNVYLKLLSQLEYRQERYKK